LLCIGDQECDDLILIAVRSSIYSTKPTKGIKLSRWRAKKLMKTLNIISCQQPGHRYKKASKEHIELPNYLDRQFAVTEPNQVW